MICKHADRRIKSFRTDLGDKYMKQDVERFVDQKGILHDKTTSHQSWRNGVPEGLSHSGWFSTQNAPPQGSRKTLSGRSFGSSSIRQKQSHFRITIAECHFIVIVDWKRTQRTSLACIQL